MSIDEVVGYYTYRSFLNRPAGEPNDILWGEGELLILISDEGTVTGTLAFPSEPGQKEFMDLAGTVTYWSELTLRFVGKGRSGTSIADYEYEYDCKVAHDWDFASPEQRVSLIGTVRRNKDHGAAKAGATASFIAVKRDFVEPRTIPGVALIPEVVTMLSERVHRLRHTVWHTLRDDWVSPKMTDADREKLKTLGWYLTDPPRTVIGGRPALNLRNGAGEDFLYMHRRMIQMVHGVYDKAGKPRPSSWGDLPVASTPQFVYKETNDPADPAKKIFVLDPGNSGAMVPPPTKAFMEQVGGTAFFRFNKTPGGFGNLMRHVASSLRNPNIAAQLTLGAYGNLIEFTVHNWMHMRWATLSYAPGSVAPKVRESYDIDTSWDAPENDYLGDFHSSHVNPLFWKLHGWVDDCIAVWFAAHEAAHPGQVKPAEVRGVQWFAPGPWVLKSEPFDWPGASDHEHGGHHGGHSGHGHDEIAQLEQVIALLKEVDARPSISVAAAELMAPRRRLSGFARSFSASELGLE